MFVFTFCAIKFHQVESFGFVSITDSSHSQNIKGTGNVFLDTDDNKKKKKKKIKQKKLRVRETGTILRKMFRFYTNTTQKQKGRDIYLKRAKVCESFNFKIIKQMMKSDKSQKNWRNSPINSISKKDENVSFKKIINI